MDSVPRALGMVDEMDDPRPGHLSERPTALTSVTSVGSADVGPMSLEARFIKSSGEEPGAKKQKLDENEEMAMDEQDGDKENAKS